MPAMRYAKFEIEYSLTINGQEKNRRKNKQNVKQKSFLTGRLRGRTLKGRREEGRREREKEREERRKGE